jgi:outer membrane beta-barrel protein
MKQARPTEPLGAAGTHRRKRRQLISAIVVAALLVLHAGPALAQKKKGGKKGGGAPAGGTDTTQTQAPPTGGAAGGGAGGEIELDQPGGAAAGAGAAGAAGAGTDQGAATTPAPDTGAAPAGGGGGICEIDPSACPKASDIKAAQNKEIKAEVYAVQQIYALRARRFEVNPYWAFSLNDQFVSHPGPGLAINYYLSNVLAIGLNFNYYQPFNVDSDFNFQNRRATRIAVPLNEYQLGGNLNFQYVPMYGKFAGFGDFIFHYDAYVVGGVGVLRDRPIPVIDPDNRKFDWQTNLDINLGLGLRIFFNRWFAGMLEIRDYIFQEKLENTQVNALKPTDSSTWFGDTKLTNAIQAQVGFSIFLPFSWEYRLPK